MSRLLVMYRQSVDPPRFEHYFREKHMPLVAKVPGLRSYSFGPASTLDGATAEYYWVYVGTFDSLDALKLACASPEAKAVYADVANFSPVPPTQIYVDDAEV